MSSVSGLCPRHTTDFGYTHRASQIPRLYSYSPKISSTSTNTSTAGGLQTNQLQWRNRPWPPMLDSRIMDPTVHNSTVAWNLSLLSTEMPTWLRHLILDQPTSPWIRPWYITTDLWGSTRLQIWIRCPSLFRNMTIRCVTIHLVTIRFVSRYTACDTLHDTIFAIHISDI